MWFLNILKGPKMGEKFELKKGDNLIGRSPQCHICINTQGISKEHAKITVTNDAVYITDLNSTNGTFVNGIKIQKQKLRMTDKVTMFDTIIAFEPANKLSIPTMNFPTLGNQALAPEFQPQVGTQTQVNKEEKPTFLSLAQGYIDNVLLPGVYKLVENMEFKWALGLMILAYVAIVTSFSVLPMIELTKSGIQQESQRRALSLAKNLADKYSIAAKEGLESSFNSASIEREPGVKSVFIISSSDGSVVAPLKRAGQRPDDTFIHDARKQDENLVQQIDDSNVGASVPIKTFDPENGSFKVSNHAIVLYDLGSLAVDSGRTFSLFIKVFAIALLIGSLLFLFIYKLVEYPIVTLNKQIDSGLKDGSTQAEVKYIFPALQDLIININTTLQRASQAQARQGNPSDRLSEARQLVENYPHAAIALDKNLNILTMNSIFEELVGLRLSQVAGQNYEALNDQALVLNLRDLIEQCISSGLNMVSGQLEFNSTNTKIVLQPIFADQGVSYYLINFQKIDSGGF